MDQKPASTTTPAEPQGQEAQSPSATLPPEITAKELQQQRKLIVGITIFVVILLAITIAAVIFLIQPTTDAERVRDVFIIMIAAMTLVMGFALILLIIQLARLINLLQNEIRPILEAMSDTSNTMRGTALFLNEHLADPVIKMNSSIAAMRRFMEMINPKK